MAEGMKIARAATRQRRAPLLQTLGRDTATCNGITICDTQLPIDFPKVDCVKVPIKVPIKCTARIPCAIRSK